MKGSTVIRDKDNLMWIQQLQKREPIVKTYMGLNQGDELKEKRQYKARGRGDDPRGGKFQLVP